MSRPPFEPHDERFGWLLERRAEVVLDDMPDDEAVYVALEARLDLLAECLVARGTPDELDEEAMEVAAGRRWVDGDHGFTLWLESEHDHEDEPWELRVGVEPADKDRLAEVGFSLGCATSFTGSVVLGLVTFQQLEHGVLDALGPWLGYPLLLLAAVGAGLASCMALVAAIVFAVGVRRRAVQPPRPPDELADAWWDDVVAAIEATPGIRLG